MKKIIKKIIIPIILVYIILLPNKSNAATVNVKQVTGLEAKSIETTSINLAWKKLKDVTGYRIYQYNNSTKKYEYYGKTTNTTYLVKNLKVAKTYKFKVRAYKTVKNKKYYGSYSSELITTTKPNQVKNVKATDQTVTTVVLSWNKVTRATGYRIYIYNNSTGKYEYKFNSTSNTKKVTGLTQSQIHKIKIRAYVTLNNNKYFGEYSKEISTYTKPSKIKNLTTSSNLTDSIELTWEKNSNASGYRIYMYDESTKSYVYKAQTEENKFTVSKLESATPYKFKVRAYIVFEKNKYFGAYSDILSTATIPEQVTNLKVVSTTENSIKIKWDKVKRATGYVIYTQFGTSFSKYKSTTENTITIKDLSAAKFYKIYVKAYITADESDYYGKKSTEISQKTNSTDTAKAGIDVSKYQGTINWKKVKAAGVDFAIIRLGWIGNKENHTLDTQFETNYNECISEEIPIGVYVYNYCNSTETVESGAKWAIKQLKDKKLDYPVFIDMEDSSISSLGKTKLTNICETFNEKIKKAGFEPGIYANKTWFTKYLDSSLKTKYTCWIAHYTNDSSIDYEGAYDVWQYSSSGLVDGISGDVDLDILYIESSDE